MSDIELGQAASFGEEDTGVSNTIFVSTKIGVRHGPRVKVAIDPPQSFRPGGKDASVTFDGEVIPAGGVPAKLLKQVQKFIELNRATLLAFWNFEIGTGELTRRLRRIS